MMPEKVDFIKTDVEGMELNVLRGYGKLSRQAARIFWLKFFKVLTRMRLNYCVRTGTAFCIRYDGMVSTLTFWRARKNVLCTV
ncbi:FkbM family methyltransferase [Ruegeria sp. HKCCA4633]|uniref:FkbM family methyltransferase n=1 Tax=Ruegeria sp. HKCCA4633 TaxID=2682983 RepID=UPI0035300BAF